MRLQARIRQQVGAAYGEQSAESARAGRRRLLGRARGWRRVVDWFRRLSAAGGEALGAEMGSVADRREALR